jgi:hypothetical protein
VLETNGGREPTRADLDNWITTFGLRVTSVIDRDPDPETETYDALGIREQAFVVDLSTMRIVFQINGSVAGIGDPSVVNAINEILRLLRMP